MSLKPLSDQAHTLFRSIVDAKHDVAKIKLLEANALPEIRDELREFLKELVSQNEAKDALVKDAETYIGLTLTEAKEKAKATNRELSILSLNGVNQKLEAGIHGPKILLIVTDDKVTYAAA